MLKCLTCVAAMGLTAAAAVAAPEQPPLPVPQTPSVPPATTPLTPVPDMPATPSAAAEPIVLYTNVKVEDRDNIPRCAVPTIIAIPDPCMPGCCRYIEICVLPDCKPRIKTSPSGRKIQYDFGDFEVEIYNKRDYVVVNYDD